MRRKVTLILLLAAVVAGTPNRMFDLKEADPQNVNVKRSAVPKEQLEAVIPTLEDQISQESKFHDPVQEDQENAKHDTEEKNHHLNENEEHFGREFWRYRNTDENDNHHTNFDDSSSEISTKEHGISHDSSSNNSDGIEENDGMWYSDSASSESGWDPSDEDSYSIESAENWFKRPGQHHILYLNHHHDHHHHQDDEDQDVHEAIHQHFHLTISDDQLYGMLGLGPIHGVIPHDEDFSSSDESDEAKNRYSVASQHHDLFGEIEFPQHVHFDRHSHRGPFFNEHLESRGHHKNVHLQYHDHDHEHSSEEGLIVPTKHHLSKHGHRWSHAYRSDSDGNSDEDHDFGTDGHQQKERRHGHSKIHSNRHHHLEEHGRHHDHIRNEDDDDHHEGRLKNLSPLKGMHHTGTLNHFHRHHGDRKGSRYHGELSNLERSHESHHRGSGLSHRHPHDDNYDDHRVWTSHYGHPHRRSHHGH